jgi:hypothetical protein
MEALKLRLEAVKDGVSRQSTLIKAIDYMLERRAGLTAFLDDGRLEPDANTVKKSIRPISIGKKNSLFSGDEGGGETRAILASLLNTAQLHGVDPETCLADVLERMVSGATKNRQLHELLVWNWKAAREQAPRLSCVTTPVPEDLVNPARRDVHSRHPWLRRTAYISTRICFCLALMRFGPSCVPSSPVRMSRGFWRSRRSVGDRREPRPRVRQLLRIGHSPPHQPERDAPAAFFRDE